MRWGRDKGLRGRWPVGRWNGRPVVGFQVKLTVDLWFWQWRPIVRPDVDLAWPPIYLEAFGTPKLLWLCFRIFIEAEYDDR